MATLEEQVKDLTERLEELEKKFGLAPLKGVVADFKLLMGGLDFRTLETIFQGESDGELACALMGQEKPVLENVKKSLSKTRWKRVHGAMKSMAKEGVTESWVKSSRESLQRKIQKLEQMGHIVVAGHEGPFVEGVWPWKPEEQPKMDLRDWTVNVLDPLAS
ncbi:MAG TPA: FliG C-terminal domain-containing protein [bacterium]